MEKNKIRKGHAVFSDIKDVNTRTLYCNKFDKSVNSVTRNTITTNMTRTLVFVVLIFLFNPLCSHAWLYIGAKNHVKHCSTTTDCFYELLHYSDIAIRRRKCMSSFPPSCSRHHSLSLRLLASSSSNNNDDSKDVTNNNSDLDDAFEQYDAIIPNGKHNQKNDLLHDKANNMSNTNQTRHAAVDDQVNEALLKRLSQLEQLVSQQAVSIKRLQQECSKLTDTVNNFADIFQKLRAAGLSENKGESEIVDEQQTRNKEKSALVNKTPKIVEAWENAGIFAQAPSTILDAADSAGAAILAGLLGGQLRMLVDVRDAELSRDPDTFVQFIELAILPVAAGLEGLQSRRNRVKLVFPTVGQLLLYRKTMALAAPEVVALSTLGLEPVEPQDNLVVIIAPSPDDEDGWKALHELVNPTHHAPIHQPIVVMNFHMLPLSGLVTKFEVAYHLRLLSVQYATDDSPSDHRRRVTKESLASAKTSKTIANSTNTNNITLTDNTTIDATADNFYQPDTQITIQGSTRAMVIRAFPRPWHVFVDVSPDTDADFVIAATFDNEPDSNQINLAIVECLEGSEHEDELVAKQMQEAWESGQLDRVSELLQAFEDDLSDDEDNDEDGYDGLWNLFREDSV